MAFSTHLHAAGLNFRTGDILHQLGLQEFALKKRASKFDLNASMLLIQKLFGGCIIANLQQHDPEKAQDVRWWQEMDRQQQQQQ